MHEIVLFSLAFSFIATIALYVRAQKIRHQELVRTMWGEVHKLEDAIAELTITAELMQEDCKELDDVVNEIDRDLRKLENGE